MQKLFFFFFCFLVKTVEGLCINRQTLFTTNMILGLVRVNENEGSTKGLAILFGELAGSRNWSLNNLRVFHTRCLKKFLDVSSLSEMKICHKVALMLRE